MVCAGQGSEQGISGKRAAVWGILFALFFLGQALAPAAAANDKSGKTSGVYEIGAGDVLDIFVYEEPEISRAVVVRRDGRISLPLVGDVRAAGRTTEELAEKITERLAKYLEAPHVTIMLAESRENVYYILGQVGTPGEYSLVRPVTLIQAVARAGGFLEWAKKARIMVVSGPQDAEKIVYFDYDRFLDNPDEEKNMVLNPGDTIIVP